MIFVDSSFWIGLYARRDRRHTEALELFMENPSERLVTTNQVRGESWTFLRGKYGHKAGVDLLDRLDRSSRLTVIFVAPEVEEEAWKWLRRHDERSYSFVDSTSFAVMRRHRIQHAFTFDGDFTAAGFIELRPE